MLLLAAAAVVVVAAVVVFVLTRGQGEDTTVTTTPPSSAPAGLPNWIEVYFTTPQPGGKPSPPGTIGRLDERLTAAIDGASQTVDMAIYDLELDNVADALVRAQGRGVRVRLVTDTDNVKTAQVERLKGARVPVVDDNRGPIMHHKFVVLDAAAVWTGSWNFTPNDTFRYNNNGVLIRSRELAENYTAEFEKMFTGKRFGPTKPKPVPYPRLDISGTAVETIFESEGDAPSRIIERIRGATQSITFLAFSFTSDEIGGAIEERFRAGVPVRGVQENLQSERQESELLRFRRAGMDAPAAAGVPVPACTAGPGVLVDGNPYLMHHKVMVIDARTVIFGSFNFTANAATDNDENLLIVDDPALAAAYLEEFCRVYSIAVERAKTRK